MLTPQALVSILQETIKIPSQFETEIQIRGRYQRLGTFKYACGYYDGIKDEEYDVQIKIIVSETIRNLLIDNQTYIFTGVVQKVVKNGSIGFNIIVMKPPVEQTRMITDKDKRLLSLLELKGEKVSIRPSLILEDILIRGRKPTIAFVFPLSTETKTEFYTQLGIEKCAYDIDEVSINFGNTEKFKKDMETLDYGHYDVIVLLGGGGAGLSFFDNLEVIESILNMETPILLGVGHGDTPVLLRQFVNEWKNNPTDTGSYLRELSERIHKQRENSENVIRNQVKKQIEEELKDLQKKNEEINNKYIELKVDQNNTIRYNRQKVSILEKK